MDKTVKSYKDNWLNDENVYLDKYILFDHSGQVFVEDEAHKYDCSPVSKIEWTPRGIFTEYSSHGGDYIKSYISNNEAYVQPKPIVADKILKKLGASATKPFGGAFTDSLEDIFDTVLDMSSNEVQLRRNSTIAAARSTSVPSRKSISSTDVKIRRRYSNKPKPPSSQSSSNVAFVSRRPRSPFIPASGGDSIYDELSVSRDAVPNRTNLKPFLSEDVMDTVPTPRAISPEKVVTTNRQSRSREIKMPVWLTSESLIGDDDIKHAKIAAEERRKAAKTALEVARAKHLEKKKQAMNEINKKYAAPLKRKSAPASKKSASPAAAKSQSSSTGLSIDDELALIKNTKKVPIKRPASSPKRSVTPTQPKKRPYTNNKSSTTAPNHENGVSDSPQHDVEDENAPPPNVNGSITPSGPPPIGRIGGPRVKHVFRPEFGNNAAPPRPKLKGQPVQIMDDMPHVKAPSVPVLPHLTQRPSSSSVPAKLASNQPVKINKVKFGVVTKGGNLPPSAVSQVPKAVRAVRCGKCSGCKSQDCGICRFCLDMPKFGGTNSIKKACLSRTCIYLEKMQTFKYKRVKLPTIPLPKTTNEPPFPRAIKQDQPASPAMGGDTSESSSSSGGSLASAQFASMLSDGAGAVAAVSPHRLDKDSLNNISCVPPDILLQSSSPDKARHVPSPALSIVKKEPSDHFVDPSSPLPQPMITWNESDGLPPLVALPLAGHIQRTHKVQACLVEDVSISRCFAEGLPIVTTVSLPIRAVCMVCASLGFEDLFFCQICCNPYHSFCLKAARDTPPKPGEEINWSCASCRSCAECGMQNDLFRCRKCVEWYHPACSGPHAVLPKKDASSWVCARCLKCDDCGTVRLDSRKSWAVTNDAVTCNDCHKQRARKRCPVCSCQYEDDDFTLKMVNCSSCDKWIHHDCMNLTIPQYELLPEIPDNIPFSCIKCSRDLPKPQLWQARMSAIMCDRLSASLDIAVCYVLSNSDILVNETCKVQFSPSNDDDPSSPPRHMKYGVFLQWVTAGIQGEWSTMRSVYQKLVTSKYQTIGSFLSELRLAVITASHDFPLIDQSCVSPFCGAVLAEKFDAENFLMVLVGKLIDSSGFTQETKESLFAEFQNPGTCLSIEEAIKKRKEAQLLIDEAKQALACGDKKELESSLPAIPLPQVDTRMVRRLVDAQGDNRQCKLCGLFGDDFPQMAGRLLYSGQNDWVHVNCAFWSAEVHEDASGKLSNLATAVARSKNLLCTGCNRRGATIGCIKCPANYHFVCGRKDSFQFLTNMTAYCAGCLPDPLPGGTDLMKDFAIDRRIVVNPEEIRWSKTHLAGIPSESLSVLVGSLTVDRLGFISDASDFKPCLIPNGFCATRVHWDADSPHRLSLYRAQVSEFNIDDVDAASGGRPMVDRNNITFDHFAKKLRPDIQVVLTPAYKRQMREDKRRKRLLQGLPSANVEDITNETSLSVDTADVKAVIDGLVNDIVLKTPKKTEKKTSLKIPTFSVSKSISTKKPETEKPKPSTNCSEVTNKKQDALAVIPHFVKCSESMPAKKEEISVDIPAEDTDVVREDVAVTENKTEEPVGAPVSQTNRHSRTMSESSSCSVDSNFSMLSHQTKTLLKNILPSQGKGSSSTPPHNTSSLMSPVPEPPTIEHQHQVFNVPHPQTSTVVHRYVQLAEPNQPFSASRQQTMNNRYKPRENATMTPKRTPPSPALTKPNTAPVCVADSMNVEKARKKAAAARQVESCVKSLLSDMVDRVFECVGPIPFDDAPSLTTWTKLVRHIKGLDSKLALGRQSRENSQHRAISAVAPWLLKPTDDFDAPLSTKGSGLMRLIGTESLCDGQPKLKIGNGVFTVKPCFKNAVPITMCKPGVNVISPEPTGPMKKAVQAGSGFQTTSDKPPIEHSLSKGNDELEKITMQGKNHNENGDHRMQGQTDSSIRSPPKNTGITRLINDIPGSLPIPSFLKLPKKNEIPLKTVLSVPPRPRSTIKEIAPPRSFFEHKPIALSPKKLPPPQVKSHRLSRDDIKASREAFESFTSNVKQSIIAEQQHLQPPKKIDRPRGSTCYKPNSHSPFETKYSPINMRPVTNIISLQSQISTTSFGLPTSSFAVNGRPMPSNIQGASHPSEMRFPVLPADQCQKLLNNTSGQRIVVAPPLPGIPAPANGAAPNGYVLMTMADYKRLQANHGEAVVQKRTTPSSTPVKVETPQVLMNETPKQPPKLPSPVVANFKSPYIKQPPEKLCVPDFLKDPSISNTEQSKNIMRRIAAQMGKQNRIEMKEYKRSQIGNPSLIPRKSRSAQVLSRAQYEDVRSRVKLNFRERKPRKIKPPPGPPKKRGRPRKRPPSPEREQQPRKRIAKQLKVPAPITGDIAFEPSTITLDELLDPVQDINGSGEQPLTTSTTKEYLTLNQKSRIFADMLSTVRTMPVRPLNGFSHGSSSASLIDPDLSHFALESRLVARKSPTALYFTLHGSGTGANIGLRGKALTWQELWSPLFGKLSEWRKTQLGLKPMRYTVSTACGLSMMGLTHQTVVCLLEQCYGIPENVVEYQFHFFPPATRPTPQSVEGCARVTPYSNPFAPSKPKRSIITVDEVIPAKRHRDVFAFLLNPFRHIQLRNSDDEKAATATPFTVGAPAAARFSAFLEHNRCSRDVVGVFPSGIHARGLFALRDFDVNDLIIEYAGEVIRAVLTDKREAEYTRRGVGCYMFRVDEDHVIDATRCGNAARFVNHSCQPNCHSKVFRGDDGRKHIVIIASVPISAGTELTYDYKFPIEDVKIPCLCGAAKCRRYLN